MLHFQNNPFFHRHILSCKVKIYLISEMRRSHRRRLSPGVNRTHQNSDRSDEAAELDVSQLHQQKRLSVLK